MNDVSLMPEGHLLRRNNIIGRAAGVFLTLHIHRAAVKRQSQGDRGRGGIGVLGRMIARSRRQSFH